MRENVYVGIYLLRNYLSPQIFLWLRFITQPLNLSPFSTPLVTEVIEEFTFAFDQFPFQLNRDLGRLWQRKEEYYQFSFDTFLNPS